MRLAGRSAALDRLPCWAILLLVAIVARAITFGNPIVHNDEQFYFVAARAWLDGALPYVGVWDRKPIGLFAIYLPAAALGFPAGIWAYQAMALASATATAALIARLATRAGWGKGALAAAVAYILWLDLLEGQGGQAPVFYNLLMIAAAGLIAPREDDGERPRRRFLLGLAALALVGLAIQVKYSVVFEGVYFGIWWLWREARLGASWHRIAAGGATLVAVALAPTAAVWAAYTAMGRGSEFFFANFASFLSRQADPWPQQLFFLLLILLLTWPLMAGAALAWKARDRSGARRPMQDWLFGWAVAAVLGMLAMGTWFTHYALPMTVPLTICCAGFVASGRRGVKAALITLAIALVAGQVMLVSKGLVRGTRAQFWQTREAIAAGPGCLFVYSGDTMFYPATGRCALSRYLFPSHLSRTREDGAIGADQGMEIGRILDLRPQVVVLEAPYVGERGDTRQLVLDRLARAYRLKAHIAYGDGWDEVYELK
uniref:hypothetical protein n=1 Tax=Altererythrobacter segetis TaxID=1104773 RepID=UPI00140D5F4E|nr:hypothetical protein [Altererythrobacter segetis]